MAANIEFDPWRFFRLIGWRLKSQRRLAFYATIGITTAYMVITLFTTYSIMKSQMNILDKNVSLSEMHYVCNQAISGIMLMLTYVIITLSPSFILYGMEEKGGRTAELTLPATTGERFWSRLLTNALITVIALAVSILLTWLANSIFWYFKNGDIMQFTPELLPQNNPFIILLVILCYSIFLFGGILFRNKAWVWTSFVCLVVFQVGGWLLSALSKAQIIDLSTIVSNIMANHYRALCVLGALLFLILSRWLFGRLQIIQHKWFNL